MAQSSIRSKCRKSWLIAASALATSTVELPERALAQCLPTVGGIECAPGGNPYSTGINNDTDITLLPGVNVVIPAGPGSINAVNSANTGGVSPGGGGPDITISANGTAIGSITINNANNPNTANNTGLRIQSSGKRHCYSNQHRNRCERHRKQLGDIGVCDAKYRQRPASGERNLERPAPELEWSGIGGHPGG
jgi:hypothetical protein